MSAQKPAAKIKEIQKDTENYINAESTSPDEGEAYDNAVNQLIEMAKNYVKINNDGADIDEGAIKSLSEKIVIPRGDFKRVFVYVARQDLIGKSNSNVHSNNYEDSDNQTEQSNQDINDSYTSELKNSEKYPEISNDSDYEDDNEEVFQESISHELATEVAGETKVTGLIKEMIGNLLDAENLHKATQILNEYKEMRVIVDFGSSQYTKNSSACFWVVEGQDGLTVLGPEIKGYRSNMLTGETDALYRYSKGLWFRKR